MTSKALELVGIQVTHSKPTGLYRIDTVYTGWPVDLFSGCKVVTGLESKLAETFVVVLRGIMDAYAPVIVNIYQNDTRTASRFFFSFYPTFGPERCGMRGSWTLWAER